MKIFISYLGLAELQSVSATPVDYGEIQDTYEIRNLIDCDTNSYAYIWNNGDQGILFHYSGLSSLPTTVYDADGEAGWYIECDRELYDAASGVNYFNYAFSDQVGAGYTTQDVSQVYGDNSSNAPNDTDVYCSGLAVVSDRRRGKIVFTKEGLASATYPYNRLLLGTADATGNGENEKIYDVMFGILMNLPTGKTFIDQTTDTYYGSDVTARAFGQVVQNSKMGSGRKRQASIIFKKLNTTEKTLVFDIFKYSRGGFPLLIIQDETDVTTWFKGIATSLEITEPYACIYNATMVVEEY